MKEKEAVIFGVMFFLVILATLLAYHSQQSALQGRSIGSLSPSFDFPDPDQCEQFINDVNPSTLFRFLPTKKDTGEITEIINCLLENNKQKISANVQPKNSFEERFFISEFDKREAEKEVADALMVAEEVPVIIWLDDQGKAIYEVKQSFLDAVPLKIMQEGSVVPFVAGNINKKLFTTIQLLRSKGVVDFVALNYPIQTTLVESRVLLGVPVVETQLGLTGKGVGVCVIDSGIDYTHPALGGCTSQQFLSGQCTKVVAGYDFCSTTSPNYPITCVTTDADALDESGHGTHVAGIVASTDSQFRGVAPGAHLLAVKVLDRIGVGDVASLAAGIDWCVQNKDIYNIRVITMSLRYVQGAYYIYTPQTCPIPANPAINKAVAAGMFVAAASGNDGSTQGMSYPACAPGVVSVGATNDANLGPGMGVDQVSRFTNRHASLDLLAPGNLVDSTAASQGFQCTGLGTSFYPCLGTSMAAPHVAGSAAVVLEKYPFFSGTQVETLLKQSGVPIFDAATQTTFPRIDLLAALSSSGSQAPSLVLNGLPQRGKTLQFQIADSRNPNKGYIFAFALSSSPPITLPDGRIIPLTPDKLFLATLFNPATINLQNNLGVLDAAGTATITWNIPSAVPPGVQIYAAFFTVDFVSPFPQNILAISPSVSFTILP